LERWLQEDRARGLDLSRAPLVRIALIEEPDGYRLVSTSHQLLSDGWSSPMIYGELFALYDACREGAPLALPERRPYRDYIAWLSTQDSAHAESFWRTALGGITAATPLGGLENRSSQTAQPETVQRVMT